MSVATGLGFIMDKRRNSDRRARERRENERRRLARREEERQQVEEQVQEATKRELLEYLQQELDAKTTSDDTPHSRTIS